MAEDKDTLVTDYEIESDYYDVYTFEEFIDICSEGSGDFEGDIYIDISSVTGEDIFNQLNDTGVPISYFTFNEGDIPLWFQGDLDDIPDGIEIEVDNSSDDILNNALSMIDHIGDEDSSGGGAKQARVITFGSAKGGSGKTFTSIITAVYYAKDHPQEKVAILDLDIEEPQMAIVIQKINKTIKSFYSDFLTGNNDFENLEKCKVNADYFPPNLDFYLTPRDKQPIQDEQFWRWVIIHLIQNYDIVFLDTGTTYMVTPAIAMAYKVADKINIVTMANLASTVAIQQQIMRLTGEEPNAVYSEEDEIEGKLNLVVTNSYDDNICRSIIETLERSCPITATFGNLTQKINKIQMLKKWDLFDTNVGFRNGIREIYS